MSFRPAITLALMFGLLGCAGGGGAAVTPGRQIVRLQSPSPPPAGAAGLPLAAAPLEAMPLSLRDVIRMALERSTVFLVLDGDVGLSDTTTVDPEIAAAGVGAEEGRFNPRLSTGWTGSRVDEPPNSFYGPGISTQTRYDEATFYAQLSQPLTTGGVASIAYAPSLGYLYFPGGAGSTQFNPAYSADLVFRLNQPVLRNAGSRRSLATIRIAKAQADQSVWDVQSALNTQIRSLSEAYWSLYAARVRLQAIDSVIPLAQESVRLERLRLQAEQVIAGDVARADVQVEELLRSRADAVQECQSRSYQLNQLMGVAPQQAMEILPVDLPVQERLPTDLASMSDTALHRLPELERLRKQIEIRTIQLGVASRDRLPDINLLAEYRTSGLSDNIKDSLEQSATLGFPTWTIGTTLEYPFGNQTARSRARAAELELTRDRLVLKRSEDKAGYTIARLLAELDAAWQQHESARRQVQQAGEWFRLSGIRYNNPLPNARGENWLLLALVDYQNAMEGYVDAVVAAAETLADYNAILARLDEAQGIAMDRWELQLAGSPPPPPTLPRVNGASTVADRPRASTGVPRTAPRPVNVPVHDRIVTSPAAWQGHSAFRELPK